jgi:hypothetical protein
MYCGQGQEKYHFFLYSSICHGAQSSIYTQKVFLNQIMVKMTIMVIMRDDFTPSKSYKEHPQLLELVFTLELYRSQGNRYCRLKNKTFK